MPNNKTAESSWLQRPCEQCKGTGQYAVDDGSGEHPIDKQCSLCEGLGHSLPMTETDLEQIKNHISNIPVIGQAYVPQLIKAVETLQQELEVSKAFYNVTLAELAHERHLHNTCKGQLEFITSKYDRCKRELEFGKSKYDRAIETERERDMLKLQVKELTQELLAKSNTNED
jgi:hypothetical protein